ncbi:hypothetical protein P43SY_009547 [Pythium insidiosum]|uniref:Uncharacterized protein n=1 Tax=Pythium insidiosum TaxID=114742 RepID=A0AAD5Q9X4_PYTIN|nr:hypothetical protein P43SY_009547 [Pythium insidiosum]
MRSPTPSRVVPITLGKDALAVVSCPPREAPVTTLDPERVPPRRSRRLSSQRTLRRGSSVASLLSSRLALQLIPRSRDLIVLGLLLGQVACAFYLFFLSFLHWFLDTPSTEYFADLLATPATRSFRVWGYVFAAIGGLHLLDVAAVLLSSWARRSPLAYALLVYKLKWGLRQSLRIVRPCIGVCLACRRSRSSLTLLAQERALDALLRSLGATFKRMHRLLRRLIGRRGLLGIEGRYFDTVFAIRELIEIVAQCFQLHKFSTLIARPWINHALVAALVVDAWSTPLLHAVFRRAPGMERLLCVIVDVQVAIFTNVVLPLFIVVPYVRKWDVATMSFPADVLYNDHRFTTVITENRCIFALSTVDGLSKLLPHLGIFAGLRALRGFVKRPSATPTTRVRRNPTAGLLRSAQQSKPQSQPQRQPLSPVTVSVLSTPTRRVPWGLRCVDLLSHGVIVAISVVVLALHLRAARLEGPASHSGCQDHVRPWLATSVACVIREFNCHRQGVESPDDAALAWSNAASLITLMITHCPALRMPVAVRGFANLISFEVYNSTIVEWNASAALDATTPQQLAYLAIIKSNMSRLPDGLVAHALPPVLRDIEIVATNLSALPSDLHLRWQPMNMLYIERSHFTEVPLTLRQLAIDDFSMAGNAIAAFPRLHHHYGMLTLSRNPIPELPSSVSAALTIDTLSLESSTLASDGEASLPPWISEQVSTPIRLWGTPYCETWAGRLPVAAKATCFGPTTLEDGRYPLKFMIPLRQP